jgi:hypothetical protein
MTTTAGNTITADSGGDRGFFHTLCWLRWITFISFGLLAWHLPAAANMLLNDAFFQQISLRRNNEAVLSTSGVRVSDHAIYTYNRLGQALMTIATQNRGG